MAKLTITADERLAINLIIDLINLHPEFSKEKIKNEFKKNKIQMKTDRFEIIYSIAKRRWIDNRGKIEECENPKASSIVLRGSTRYVNEQIARELDDALGVVAATIEEGKVLIGGGACEIDLIKQLREYGETVSGREQLAILKYAEALEVIPRTLIENAGLDTINLIADLKAAHEDSNLIGINVFDGKVVDMKEAGVIEPLRVKIQALQSAGAASEMILRIDDMIAARNALNSTGPDESGNDDSGMPPMPGMGGGMPPMM